MQNDIYNNKGRWENLVRKTRAGKYCKKNEDTEYVIRNPENLKYFEKLITEFEFRDLSYQRRILMFKALRKTCFHTKKDIKDLTQEEVKQIVVRLYEKHKSPITKKCYIDYNKYMWKILFPELDSQGRPDNSIIPYAWRIKSVSDKSLKRDKRDKMPYSDYIKIINGFSHDTRMQLYFSLMYECLARPQELSYVDIGDVQKFDNYARIRIKSHGKEGTKTLQVIDSYYFLSKWLNEHPLSHDPDAPLFVTISNSAKTRRLSPEASNDALKVVLKKLGIDKPYSNYSFKRNGVTIRYRNGDSPQHIQKIAGWTSTEQLKAYDLSDQEDFLEAELVIKGIRKAGEKHKHMQPTSQRCVFCNTTNPMTNITCSNCARPLKKEDLLRQEQEKDEEINQLRQDYRAMVKIMAEKGWLTPR